MSRWYDYYPRLSPLFESLQFIKEEVLEDIAFDILKLTRKHHDVQVFDAILDNLAKARPHRRWYDKNEFTAMIYYSLEGADKQFIDAVTNYLDDVIPEDVKLLGEEISALYRQVDS